MNLINYCYHVEVRPNRFDPITIHKLSEMFQNKVFHDDLFFSLPVRSRNFDPNNS